MWLWHGVRLAIHLSSRTEDLVEDVPCSSSLGEKEKKTTGICQDDGVACFSVTYRVNKPIHVWFLIVLLI